MSGPLEAQLADAVAERDRAAVRLEAATAARTDARELGGGLLSFGGSGSQTAARKVRAATDRAMRAWNDAHTEREEWDRKVRRLEGLIVERDRPRLTRDDIAGARAVRTRHGWHEVVRVNAKSVTVKTAYSWTDRIEFSKVLEVSS